MKKISIGALVLLLCAVAPARLRAAGPSVAAGGGGVQQLNEAFLKAMQAGDIDGVMKLYGADAVFFPPGRRWRKGWKRSATSGIPCSRPTRSPTAA